MTLIGRPDDRTNATASRLNSGDHRRRESPMMDGLLPRPPSLCQVSLPAGDAHPTLVASKSAVARIRGCVARRGDHDPGRGEGATDSAVATGSWTASAAG